MFEATEIVCAGCGVLFGERPPSVCPICYDERQVPPDAGQVWLTPATLAGHRTTLSQITPNLWSIGTTPQVGIGHRALLFRGRAGQILWDCPPMLDEHAIAFIRDGGPLLAIAGSHPHFYGAARALCREFDAPVYSHGADEAWMLTPPARWTRWEDTQLELAPGVTLHHLGGHFPGSALLAISDAEVPGGTLLTGDTLHPAPDGASISCMFSFPRGIPLDRRTLESIRDHVERLRFSSLHGGFDPGTIPSDARAIALRSLDQMIRGERPGSRA